MSSSTTGVDEMRNALGKRLRELRVAAGLSGKQLAESLSWVGSKISKIENGKQTPTDDDIRDWTRATNSHDQTAGFLATLHNLELQHAEWQRVLKAGLKPHQLVLSQVDERTKFYRGFENTVIPGLTQTPEYARARFAQVVMAHGVPNDINQAVKARMRRQEMLYRPDKRFHFVITEAALRYRLVTPDIMIGQLDRLMAMTAMRNVKLGIVAFETHYSIDPRHGFWLLDDQLVRFESYSAEINLRQPQEVELYSGIFEQLAVAADYRGGARAIISRVMHELGSETEDSGT
ncbi:MAG: helix-turn-helix domain-containing protein [Nocardioides sp.]